MSTTVRTTQLTITTLIITGTLFITCANETSGIRTHHYYKDTILYSRNTILFTYTMIHARAVILHNTCYVYVMIHICSRVTVRRSYTSIDLLVDHTTLRTLTSVQLTRLRTELQGVHISTCYDTRCCTINSDLTFHWTSWCGHKNKILITKPIATSVDHF